MGEKRKDDYKVCIWGTTASKIETKRIGLATIIGSLGVVLSIVVFGPQGKAVGFIISLALAAFGYFGVAKKIFKGKSKT